jgi:GT2 family glycosyltransferase
MTNPLGQSARATIAVTAQDVAVIIVNFNGGEYLIRCLQALTELSEQPGEIIVVDNASEDSSAAVAVARFPNIQLIEAGSNTGFAVANNIGIAATDKPWIALINPDAYVEPGWMAAILSAVNGNPGITFFSAELVDANDHRCLDGQGDCYHVSGLMWRRKHGQPVKGEPSRLPMFAPCAASALYEKAAVLEVGGFDEDYFCYIEDIDLGFRLRLAGYDCLHVSAAIAYHEGSAITERESDFSIYYGHRNLVWTYFKNMPTKLLWLYLPQHILMNMTTILYYTAKRRPGVIFKAKWHALRGLPAALRKRAEVQAGSAANVDIRTAMARGWTTPYLHRHD